MHLIEQIKEEFKEHGTLVYAWSLSELLNNKEAQKVLTKSDNETILRVMKKIEKQHR